MKTRLPTLQEIDELIAFLPRLYAEGFKPIDEWGGGTVDEDGILLMPWPKYNKVVEEFFQHASRECWLDCSYKPEEAASMLMNHEFMRETAPMPYGV